MSRRKIAWIVAVVAGAALAVVLGVLIHHWRPRSLTIRGAVIRQDDDTRKQSPIADVLITASDGVTSRSVRSDAAGYFSVKFPEAVWPGQTVNLDFQHADYLPMSIKLRAGLRLASKELYVAAMKPIAQQSTEKISAKTSVVTNVRVRYSVNSQEEQNVGSAVKTFQAVNKPNVPCGGKPPCSPDGIWKATSASVTLDAGPENQFRNVRLSCIAGPCPFTRIDASGYANGGRTITASATSWSDTATFLLEAEVYRSAISSRVRHLYPVVFGRDLHFTLPPTQEGVSLEADLDGVPMVFPLGPELYLSWATCSVRDSPDPEKTTVYRCELKPGYRF
ncbi:MAG TPA: hypothetical protein VGG45_08010 [Terracidiphilus sp.]